ncbi:MAG: hypothetical protein JNM56_32580, partial [Planctomycetia bacterium]|nr:hypothetical protein [Planctomycetia bacterium]
ADISEEELRGLKKELTAARKKVKLLEEELLRRLDSANEKLATDGRRELVLELERDAFAEQLERYVAAHRQQIAKFLEGLWEKYRVAMRDIESERSAATERMTRFMRELGYVR